jgi:diguanylate cyclase (GGDEF)-like protein/PAS domain S-box-containing protein
MPTVRLAGGEGLLRDCFEVSAISTFFLSRDDELVFVNRAFADLLGYDLAQCAGLDISTIVHPDDAGLARAQVESVVRGEPETHQAETRYLRKTGEAVWVQVSVSRLGGRHGHAPYLIVQAVDIDHRKRTEAELAAGEIRWHDAEEKLQFANTLLRAEMDASPDGILVVDARGRIISYNQRFATMWQIPLDLLKAEDDAPVLMAVTSAMKNPEEFASRVHYIYEHPEAEGHDELETRDGRSIDRHTEALCTPAGDYLGRVWFFRDVTERKRAEAQILRMARTDALTGLPNRLVFMEAVERATAAVKRGGMTFAVLYLDLNHFKDVNDTLGHPIGDELLKAVVGRLRSATRDCDVVARFGGDEFAIIVTDVREPEDAAAVATALLRAMQVPFSLRGYDIRSGISIGIALFGPDQPGAETMLARADIALYRAKSEGKEGYRFHTDAMDNEIRTRVMLSSELREGIELGQLFLVYQPQVDIATGRIIGVEALIRWRHPVHGVLGPNIFLPMTEKTGLIAAIGRWVLREACNQTKEWLDAGIAPDVVGVNLSGVQFKRAFELEAEIAAILAETGMPANRLELELTETVLMAAGIEHNDVLNRLRQSGIKLAIDDFGVGYSSLDYLRRFPVDRIKIAGAFVVEITTEAGSSAIVKATLGLARELGIRVIAEGVETPAQLELLRGWGCREAQGYYFARPLAVDDLTPLLRCGQIRREPDF